MNSPQTLNFPQNLPHQDTVGISEIFRILNRGKWIIAATIVVCLAATWIYTARLPRLYTAMTRIDIDLQGRPGIKIDSDLGASNSAAKLDTQLGILRSQSLALDVIKRLHLYSDHRFTGVTLYPPDTDVDKLPSTNRLLLISRFLGGLSVMYERGTEIADIQYRSTDPTLAAEIANEIAESYENRNFQTRYQTTLKASTWLNGQLESLRKSVLEAQKKFADYQKQNGMLQTDETHSPGSEKLAQLNAALASAEVQRILKETIYRASLSADVDQISSGDSFPELVSLRAQKASLDGQYASLSAKYGDAYPRVVQLKKEMDQVESAIDREEARAKHQIEMDYISARNNESGLKAAVEQQTQEIFAINSNALQYSILAREVVSTRDLYEDLNKKLQEAGITSGLSADSIAVIDPALPPYVPSAPRKTLNLEVGFLIGAILGIGFSIVFELINSTIRTIDDIRLYSGLPSLGMIPHVEVKHSEPTAESLESSGPGSTQTSMKVTDDPRSHFAEAYRNVRSSLLLSSAGGAPQVIVISSAWPQEGKTTTAINLATVLAQSGKEVLLVDADLKRPSLHATYGTPGTIQTGLSEMLSGSGIAPSIVSPDQSIPTLKVILSGTIPPSSSELLMSAEMGSLIEEWRARYDFIVIDTAPLLAVSDAYFMVSKADTVVLVVRSGSTRRKALRALRDAVLGVRGKIAGVLLNDVKASSDAYYEYYGGSRKNYDIYYSSERGN